jgi:hypothetical protein
LINYAQTGDTSDIGVDQCDDFYHWGNIGGDFAQFFDAPVGISAFLERKGLLKGHEIVFSKDFRVAPLGGSKPQGWQDWLPHYHRRIVDGAGNPVEGGGIGWHRPWQNGF